MDFIDDYHGGLPYYFNMGIFDYSIDQELNNFEQNMIESLKYHYVEDRTFKIIHSKKFIVQAIIYDKLHIIGLNEDKNVIYWKVSIISE